MDVSSRFAIIGGGWRAEFFLRAAAGLRGEVACEGVTSRRPERREELEQRFGATTFGSVEEALDRPLGFVVLAVTREQAVPLLEEICTRSAVAVLLETPPGLEVADLRRAWAISVGGAKVQVAEQYRWQPHHAARLAVLNEGVIGERHQAWVSVAHGYHAASLLREYLGTGGAGWRQVTVTAHKLVSPVFPGPGRAGPPASGGPQPSERVIAVLSGGAKHGIYDFDGEQYFSEIRSQHVAVRGERGEMRDDHLSYLGPGEHWRATQSDLARVEGGKGGDLNSLGLHEIRFQGRPVYRKPAYIGILPDEEIAIAECLYHMARHVAGGPEFYTVERACRDRYCELAILASAEQGRSIVMGQDDWKDPAERRW